MSVLYCWRAEIIIDDRNFNNIFYHFKIKYSPTPLPNFAYAIFVILVLFKLLWASFLFQSINVNLYIFEFLFLYQVIFIVKIFLTLYFAAWAGFPPHLLIHLASAVWSNLSVPSVYIAFMLPPYFSPHKTQPKAENNSYEMHIFSLTQESSHVQAKMSYFCT